MLFMTLQLEKLNKGLEMELLACMRLLHDPTKGGDQFTPMSDDYQMISLLVVVTSIETG